MRGEGGGGVTDLKSFDSECRYKNEIMEPDSQFLNNLWTNKIAHVLFLLCSACLLKQCSNLSRIVLNSTSNSSSFV